MSAQKYIALIHRYALPFELVEMLATHFQTTTLTTSNSIRLVLNLWTES